MPKRKDLTAEGSVPSAPPAASLSPIPSVSVAITAYNSDKWLARALDGVLMQRREFPIEIIIGDDCSQDATISLARSYRERYPEVVRVFERTKNVGIQRNYYETLAKCRGKYIAWLDADDYWTDPDKLAIQVRALESDPSLSVCVHRVRWITADGEVKRIYPVMPEGRYGLGEIVRHDFIPTASAVVRNGFQGDIPAWYFDIAPTTDWPVWVLSALSGDILLLERVMADYWLTPNSACWSRGDLFWYQMDARFYEHVEDIIPPEWHRVARAEKGRRYEAMAYTLRKRGDFTGSREAAWRAFRSPSPLDNVVSKAKSLLAAAVREMEWRVRGAQTAKQRDGA
jgi:glycosyltransferase involved in cell wall biosynthesis